MILARPICKVRDTIQVLFKEPKGEEVKISMVPITWSVKSSVQSQGMRESEAVMKRGKKTLPVHVRKEVVAKASVKTPVKRNKKDVP